jgi:monovalent cation/hydrogen antiporter
MFIFEIIIALLLVGAVLPLWAARLGVPYPALLALTGAALALRVQDRARLPARRESWAN